jgi:hypothetical protein
VVRPAVSALKTLRKRKALRLNAMKFNMMVAMTSCTPRVTFSQPAIPFQSAPTRAAMSKMDRTWSTAGIE